MFKECMIYYGSEVTLYCRKKDKVIVKHCTGTATAFLFFINKDTLMVNLFLIISLYLTFILADYVIFWKAHFFRALYSVL